MSGPDQNPMGQLVSTFRPMASVFAVAVVVILTACSAAPDDPTGATEPPAIQVQSRNEFMADCLTDKGFPPVGESGGMFMYNTPESQVTAFEAAEAGCLTEMDRRFGVGAPMDEDALTAFYWQLVETARCLVMEGYFPPPAPSLEAFLEQPGVWHPYLAVDPPDPAEWDRINGICPQP